MQLLGCPSAGSICSPHCSGLCVEDVCLQAPPGPAGRSLHRVRTPALTSLLILQKAPGPWLLGWCEVLNHGSYSYPPPILVTLRGKMDFADVIRLRIWGGKIFFDHPGRP